MNVNEIVLVDDAKKAASELTTIEAVKEDLDKLVAIETYLSMSKKDKKLEIRCVKHRLYCERRLGKLLGEAKLGRPDLMSHRVTFSITRNDAMRYRKLAAIAEEDFDERLNMVVASGEVPSRNTVLFSSDTTEHCTPDSVLELVMPALGDIDLDPCSDPGLNVPAKNHFTQEENGLGQEWCGRVFMNPPYGKEIDQWIVKLLEEYDAKRMTAAIVLVPARTDTVWFNRLAAFPVCFVKGRLKFKGNPDVAPFPSAVFYLGKAERRFIRQFKELGTIWKQV